MAELELASGAVFSVRYPFVLEDYAEPIMDEEGGFAPENRAIKTWRPGVRFENEYPDSAVSVADRFGSMELTVVSVHKPGRYPARVFFTRQWVDPDGRRFGKPKLRITTAVAFRSLRAGYRHDVERVTNDGLPAAREAPSSDSVSTSNDGEIQSD